ncbi:MAG TPA: ribulokinase [Spirochaetia bacterium]|nr:ribulokinase [Spirochaetia bacterium]
MASGKLIIGMDFGTDSVRAEVIDAEKGTELASEVAWYKRWGAGKYCDPAKNMFRQHPQDYIDGMVESVTGALSKLGKKAGAQVVGIGIDTTGSTPCAVDKAGTPLSLTKGFEENPNAMFVLWKDHTGVKEAELINKVARSWGGTDFTKYEGGVYSSEWFWSKILHVLREDRKVRAAAFSWVEHCDWMPAILTGITDPLTLKRGRCAAGHKAMWHAEWGGLPPEEFLTKLDPVLKGLRARLYTETFTSDVNAGGLTEEWARKLGLPAGIAVAVGAFDAHMGGVGGQISGRTLVKIMGTSTCDMMVAPAKTIGTKTVPGICGQVDGSIIPGMIGLEAGQSAFGDVYAWFKDVLAWPLTAIATGSGKGARGSAGAAVAKVKEEIEDKLLDRLAEEAEKIDPSESTVIALDWLNGRRTPFADQTLKGAIVGLTLGTTAPKIFRALVEATAFGSRAIVEQFRKEGVPIDAVIALGGIARKSPFVMQVTADVLGMPIKVAASEQTVALGAGMFAAVAAGVYKNVADAQKKMGSGFDKTFTPNRRMADIYNKLYKKYVSLGESLQGLLQAL